MSDHTHDLKMLRKATDRLLEAVGTLGKPAIARPSRLPGWTRGHVLAHLARNADALVNLLTWARTGLETPMYADEAARDRAIGRDASRPLAVHLADLRTSAARFEEAAAALAPEQWSFRVTMRNGVTDLAAGLPFRRLAEVELHHVDLGIGYEVRDLPVAFLERELEFLAEVKFAGHPGVPPLRLRPVGGRPLRTGRAEGADRAEGGTPATTVSGTADALVGWLTGRTDGTGLEAGDAPLPAIPPL